MIEKFGGASRDRTDDLIVANDALSQLSYSPVQVGLVAELFYQRFEVSTTLLTLQRLGLRIPQFTLTKLANLRLTSTRAHGEGWGNLHVRTAESRNRKAPA